MALEQLHLLGSDSFYVLWRLDRLRRSPVNWLMCRDGLLALGRDRF